MNPIQVYQPIDLIQFPFPHRAVIEASAGTGKTYTIAALYVRLVLGHGTAGAVFQRPLMPSEILVVTYTKAATHELRDRIRRRLQEVARDMSQYTSGTTIKDDFVRDLVTHAQWSDPQARREAVDRLELAAQSMDESAIFTIHGWCQRMLIQHAFQTGSSFDHELSPDQESLLRLACQDYWRQHIYGVRPNALEQITEVCASPDDLYEIAKHDRPGKLQRFWQGEPMPCPLSPAALEAERLRWHERGLTLAKTIHSQVVNGAHDVIAMLSALYLEGAINRNKFKQPKFERLIAHLSGLAGLPSCDDWTVLDDLSEALSQSSLNKLMNTKSTAPVHPLFGLLDDWRDFMQGKPSGAHWVHHALDWLAQHVESLKRAQATLNYDDLLERLNDALNTQTGPGLVTTLSTQYPVAMIDEFQDTDPLQFAIFDRIYKKSESSNETGLDSGPQSLLMIGDPKQAIYSFRGADLYTYIQARESCGNDAFTLSVNFRSDRDMVNAVNQLFVQGDQKSAGAFLVTDTSGQKALPFNPVSAHRQEAGLLVDDLPGMAVVQWWYGAEHAAKEGAKTLKIGEYRFRMAQQVAHEIIELMSLSQQGRLQVDKASLQFSDCAVIVRSGKEAEVIQRVFSEANIPSVYLSERDNVFTSPEARDLWLILKAMLNPGQLDLVKAAMLTRILGLGLDDFKAHTEDAQFWDQQIQVFQQLNALWKKAGVLGAIRYLIGVYGLSQSEQGGLRYARTLTNLLHLAETLQTRSVQFDGPAALLRHFEELMLSASDADEENTIRLESDSQCVQIITMHKAKGLEYPIVFIPFGLAGRGRTSNEIHWHSPEGGRCIDFKREKNTSCDHQATQARLEEELRLFYVALTRAKFRTYIGYGAVDGYENSAAASLMGVEKPEGGKKNGKGTAAPQVSVASTHPLRVVLPNSPHCEVIELEPIEELKTWVNAESTLVSAPIPMVSRPVRGEAWWVASYSALRLSGELPLQGEAVQAFDTALEEKAQEERLAVKSSSDGAISSESSTQAAGIHAFPKGAEAGTLMHDALEWIMLRKQQGQMPSRIEIEDWLRPRLERRTWQKHHEVLANSLLEWTSMRFHHPQLQAMSLQTLTEYWCEMEFWFSVTHAPVAQVDQLIRIHEMPGVSRPLLQPQHLNGLFKGFMDLVFQWGGKYWVADYKSNYLGHDQQAYTNQALADCVLHHRYEVQYCLYVLALHRLLKTRMKLYADNPKQGYEAHIGGAVYLFLRGTHNATTQGVWLSKPSYELIAALDGLFEGLPESPELTVCSGGTA